MVDFQEKDIQKFFLDRLKASGHTFENKVGEILQESFDVKREVPYYDKDGKINRAIDFKAETYFPGAFELKITKDPALGVLNLIVECKDKKNVGWIFYEDSLAHNTLQSYDTVNWLSHTKKIAGTDFPILPGTPIRDIFYASKHVEYFYSNDKDECEKNSKISPFIDSVYPVSKATNHFLENERKMYEDVFLKQKLKFYPHNQTFTVFQPLIVFSGYLYEVIDDNEDIKLNSLQMVQMKKTYFSDNYKIHSGVIHIVTLEGLPKYIEKLKKYFHINDEFLKWKEESERF